MNINKEEHAVFTLDNKLAYTLKPYIIRNLTIRRRETFEVHYTDDKTFETNKYLEISRKLELE